MKYIIALLLGILISNLAGIYCSVTFGNWVDSHAPKTIAMPITADFCIAEFISRPIDKIINNEVFCGLLGE